jgi:hypothetical protein
LIDFFGTSTWKSTIKKGKLISSENLKKKDGLKPFYVDYSTKFSLGDEGKE